MSGEFKIDFVGIGAPRCGTTWLSSALAAHPHIGFSAKKEIHFFCSERAMFPLKNVLRYNGRNLSRYATFFKRCRPDQVKGEFSVDYFLTDSAARHIREIFPDVKIIAVLREPVSRFISHYHFRRYTRQEDKRSLDGVLQTDERFISHGFYARNLKRYFDLFPKEHIKVLIYEEMRADPHSALREVYSFLGVDPSFVPHELMKKSVNTAARVRFRPIMRVIEWAQLIAIWSGVEWLISDSLKSRASHMLQRVNFKKLEHESIGDETKEKIRRLYVEDIRKLEELLSRDLSGVWRV